MKPTQEQLNDPKWWGENAPEGADALVDGDFVKWVEGIEFIFSHGEWLPDTDPWTLQEYKNDPAFCVSERPTKPVFVPNTETKTIYWVAEVDSYGTPWNFDGPHDDYKSAEDSIPLLLAVCDKNRKLVVTSMEFRPIKSERELLIEIIVAHGNLSEGVLADGILSAGFCLKEPTK